MTPVGLAKIIGLALIGCILLLIILGLIQLGFDAHRLLTNTNSLVEQEKTDLHSTSQNLNAILLQAGLATDEARRAATEQRIAWAKNADEIGETAQAARDLIARTDKDLNDQTLPMLRTSIDTMSWNTNQILVALDSTINSIDTQVNNPDLRDTLHHLDVTALHLDLATGNANQILSHGDHIMSYYDQRLTSPRGFVRTLGSGLLHLVVPAASVATALK